MHPYVRHMGFKAASIRFLKFMTFLTMGNLSSWPFTYVTFSIHLTIFLYQVKVNVVQWQRSWSGNICYTHFSQTSYMSIITRTGLQFITASHIYENILVKKKYSRFGILSQILLHKTQLLLTFTRMLREEC